MSKPRIATFFATRAALGWAAFGWTALASLLAAWIIAPDASLSERVWWLGLGVLAIGPALAVYAVGARWVGASRRANWRVVVVALVAWGLRGLILAIGAGQLGLTDTTEPLGRIIGSALTMTLWTLVLGALVEARRQYRQALASRFASEQVLQEAYRRLQVPIDEQIETDVRNLGEQLAEMVTVEKSSGDSTTHPFHDSGPAQELVRPLAHKYWQLGRREQSWWQRATGYLHRLVRSELNATVVVVAYFAGLISTVPVRVDPLVGLVFVVVLAACLAGVWAGVRAVVTSAGMRAPWTTLTYLASGVGMVLAVSDLAGDVRQVAQIDSYGRWALASALVVTMIVVLCVQAAVSVANERLEELDLEAMDTRLALQAEITRWRSRHVSTHLHNEVQSALTAAYLRMAEHGSAAELETQLQDIQVMIEGIGEVDVVDQASAVAGLESSLESWAGLADVRLQLDPQVASSLNPLIPSACSILKELVTNSIRHGKASRVEVDLTFQPTEGRAALVARVRDNGSWRSAKDPGVGLAMAEQAGWQVERESDAAGTVVTLRER